MSSKQPYPWATGPMELLPTPQGKTGKTDIYTSIGTKMALVHNAFIRAFNGTYHVAPNVPQSDLKNFLEYARELHVCLKQHHHEEEEFIFPLIEDALGEKGLMDGNVEQHKAFETGLEAYREYVDSLLGGDMTKFSATKYRELIDSFKDPLRQHLYDEIDTLVALEKYDGRFNLAEITEIAEQKAIKSYSLTSSIPVLILNHDRSFEDGIHGFFPPMPAAMNWTMRKIVPCWYWGRWKYATCDSNQMPRALPY